VFKLADDPQSVKASSEKNVAAPFSDSVTARQFDGNLNGQAVRCQSSGIPNMGVLSRVFLGIYLLVRSPSGVFGLLTLGAITWITLKVPGVGGLAFSAFCAVIPAVLAICEHREALQVMRQSSQAAGLPEKGKL
jgi:hypothetical protein